MQMDVGMKNIPENDFHGTNAMVPRCTIIVGSIDAQEFFIRKKESCLLALAASSAALFCSSSSSAFLPAWACSSAYKHMLG